MALTVNEAEKKLSLVAKKDVADFHYTACYCEENIYHLCRTLSEQGLAANDASDLFVVFISNNLKQVFANCCSCLGLHAELLVPLWKQKNGLQPNGYCEWDYHVICIQKTSKPDEFQVWDLDTSLSLPVLMNKYWMEALWPLVHLVQWKRRLFRVITAPMFLRYFASDRRHMKSSEGLWLASPPPYDCIVAEDGEVHNLPEYNTIVDEQVLHNTDVSLDRLQGEKFGVVLSQDGWLKLFGGTRTQAVSVRNHLQVT